MSGNREHSLSFFVLLALVLHSLLPLIPSPFQNFVSDLESKQPPEIVVERWPDGARAIVQSSRVPESANSDQQARFLGEYRNRTDKETQSPLRGRFREGSTDHPPGEWSEEGEPKLSDLLGASPNGLPDDIEKGPQTVLNTDPVLYASFLNRIADEVYDPWVRWVQRARDEYERKGKRLDSDSYSTKLLVSLDRNGDVTDIRILKQSGKELFDIAPIRALREVGHFENPPAQMFADNDVIRFTYDFQIEIKATFMKIVPYPNVI
ncbi:MAG: TonB C-terminal domain-containing protein [Deltaproteobacteria bacterium]|nr:TonB C-terminal domain-containing protein [Deltaproteobacteria bacterium]